MLERLQYLLHMLSREQVCGRSIDRKALPTLKAISALVAAAPETVCRELNRLMPAQPRKQREQHHCVAAKPSAVAVALACAA